MVPFSTPPLAALKLARAACASPSSWEPSRVRASGSALESEEMLLRSCCTFWSAPWTCASHPLSPLATGFTQSTVHDDSDVGDAAAAGAVDAAAAGAVDGAAAPLQLLLASVPTRPYWA